MSERSPSRSAKAEHVPQPRSRMRLGWTSSTRRWMRACFQPIMAQSKPEREARRVSRWCVELTGELLAFHEPSETVGTGKAALARRAHTLFDLTSDAPTRRAARGS